MRHFSRKVLITASIAALGLGSFGVHAADNANITASISAVGALVATNVTPTMAFGTWLMTGAGGAGEELVFVKNPTTGAVVLTPGATSTATNIVPNTTPAAQTVAITDGSSTEDGLIINAKWDMVSNFVDTDAVLSAISYKTATDGPTVMTESTDYPVHVVAGATPEPVTFGGTVTVAGPITGANTAVFKVTYSY